MAIQHSYKHLRSTSSFLRISCESEFRTMRSMRTIIFFVRSYVTIAILVVPCTNCSRSAYTNHEYCSCHQCVKYTCPCEWDKYSDPVVNYVQTTRDSRGLVHTGTHPPALSRRVHDEFTNSSRTVVVTKILHISKFSFRQARSHDRFTHTSR